MKITIKEIHAREIGARIILVPSLILFPKSKLIAIRIGVTKNIMTNVKVSQISNIFIYTFKPSLSKDYES